MVTPYSTESSKKEQVSQMFDNIAGSYDFLNHFLSLGIDKLWRNKMIRELAAINPKIVLDVATGTGDVAIESFKQLHDPSLKIIGVDISPKMLAVGREKIVQRKMNENITLTDGDSENLAFSDNKFDAITVAYGVRNFENLERGLAEMQRVLKPGGKLLVLEFSKPTGFPVKQAFNLYFEHILPTIGKFTSKDNRAYKYLFESVQVFPSGEAFVHILDQLGYTKTSCQALSFGICSLYVAYKP